MNMNNIIYYIHLLGYDIFVQSYQAKADSYVPRLWIAVSAIRFIAGLHVGRSKIDQVTYTLFCMWRPCLTQVANYNREKKYTMR